MWEIHILSLHKIVYVTQLTKVVHTVYIHYCYYFNKTRLPRPILDWPRSSLGFLAVLKSLVPGSSVTLSFPRRFFLLIVNLYTNKHQVASNT